MYITSDNVKFTSYNDFNDVVNKLFESLLLRYKDNFETLMRQSDFVFDLVQLILLKCHRVTFKRDGSYINSLVWLKNKKSNNKPAKWR